MHFKNAGDVIYLIGEQKDDIGSSEYLHKILEVKISPAPYFNLNEEFAVQDALLQLIENRLINSAHDLSEGGLFVALCESGFFRELGFDVSSTAGYRKDGWYFGEAQGRIIISVDPSRCSDAEGTLNKQQISFKQIGNVTSGDLIIDGETWDAIRDWKHSYDTAIESLMHQRKEKVLE
jgi:phosphoribosylformylglycinamidine synthase subunit PurL